MANPQLKSVTKAIRQVEDVLKTLKGLRLDVQTDAVNDHALAPVRQAGWCPLDCPHAPACNRREKCWAMQIAVREKVNYLVAYQRVADGEQL